MITLFEEAKAIAPPEPPSPIMIEMFGTVSDIQHSIEFAIAEACPLCSAPKPGYAPGVSIKLTNWNLKTISKLHESYTLPDNLLGASYQNFFLFCYLRSSPFSCPIIKTDLLSINPKPAVTDLSSPKYLISG